LVAKTEQNLHFDDKLAAKPSKLRVTLFNDELMIKTEQLLRSII